MANFIAHVLTPWIGDGSTLANAQRPKIGDEYALAKCTDITGQPAENLHPDPNLLVVEIVCDEATLAAINADAEYHVLSSEVL